MLYKPMNLFNWARKTFFSDWSTKSVLGGGGEEEEDGGEGRRRDARMAIGKFDGFLMFKTQIYRYLQSWMCYRKMDKYWKKDR